MCQLQSLIETTFGNDGYTPLIAYRIMSNTLNYKLTSKVQLLLTKRIVHHIHNEFVALCTCAVSLVILVSVALKTKTARITAGSADHTISVAV